MASGMHARHIFRHLAQDAGLVLGEGGQALSNRLFSGDFFREPDIGAVVAGLAGQQATI